MNSKLVNMVIVIVCIVLITFWIIRSREYHSASESNIQDSKSPLLKYLLEQDDFPSNWMPEDVSTFQEHIASSQKGDGLVEIASKKITGYFDKKYEFIVIHRIENYKNISLIARPTLQYLAGEEGDFFNINKLHLNNNMEYLCSKSTSEDSVLCDLVIEYHSVNINSFLLILTQSRVSANDLGLLIDSLIFSIDAKIN